MGGGRSLTRLRQVLADLGLTVSLNTLKTYSVQHGWAEKARRNDETHLVDAAGLADTDMASRHADMAVAMQEIAGRTLERFLEQPDRPMTPRDVCTLLDVGIRIERQARNAEISKHELTVQIVDPLIRQIAALFEQVNVMVDANARKRQFALGADAIIVNSFPEDV